MDSKEEEEEEDYMSDAFLVDSEVTKPGLLARKMAPVHVRKLDKEKRIKEINERHRLNNRPVKQVEQEKRDEKLNKAIDSSNKGFAMLAKMGFKEGDGLGKHGTGRSEPIPLEIKTDRGGLGRDTMLQKRKEMQVSFLQQMASRKRQMVENLQGDFKKRMKGKFLDKQVTFDLRKAQKACEQLDSAKNLEAMEKWFWQIPDDNESGDDDSDDSEETDKIECPEEWEMLEKITQYLRGVHLYCVWCGITYNDEDDLNGSCPGNTFESHN
ncbi:G patch domain-containing protein 11-like isoform X2 [Rhopilema esculentum]|uniref:G patch domain-containing protein 11-like isoform X2 n=1 Tax=Rhopilema esculentum TaxID=499914 RepID=UPI0031D78626